MSADIKEVVANSSVEDNSANSPKISKKKAKKISNVEEIKNDNEHTINKTLITDKTTYYSEKKESKQIIKENTENGTKITKIYSKEESKKIYKVKKVK
jgi:hypothetical protein